MTRPVDVLVAGAGPSGLTLALQAHDNGANVRIVDRRPEAFRPSRALILHPRTLEVLRPLGVTDALLARADTAPRANLHLGRRTVGVQLGNLSMPKVAFPLLSLVRQMDVETVLAEALAQRGVVVERGTELVDVRDGPDSATATLRTLGGTERASFDFVAGCDGQDSVVRRDAGIDWRGGPYAEEVILADLELSPGLTPGMAHVVARGERLLFVFALGECATWRLLVTRRATSNGLAYGQPGPPVAQSELQSMLDGAGLEVRITNLAWSARYPLQHRMASHFRRGRLFIAGDAAHAHSPATGQGMNTSIQDAANLGWKLAFAPFATEPGALLDSYELERRPVARRLLAITHAVFWAEASTHPLPSFVRSSLVPLFAPLLPFASRQHWLVATGLRQMTQWRTAYGKSPISMQTDTKGIRGPGAGQRLPDATVFCDNRPTRLHELTAAPGIHILLSQEAPPIEHDDLGPYVSFHRLTSSTGAGILAIRPDGYVGFRGGANDGTELETWLERIGAIRRS